MSSWLVYLQTSLILSFVSSKSLNVKLLKSDSPKNNANTGMVNKFYGFYFTQNQIFRFKDLYALTFYLS